MRNVLVGIIDKATRWLDREDARAEERRILRGRKLCLDCIYHRDDTGRIVEVIDCQTLKHHKP